MRIISIFALCIALAGCVSQPRADSQSASQLINGDVPQTFTRLYVYTGHTIWGDGSEQAYLNSFDITVDGKKIGGANNGEVLVADIQPGKHLILRYAKTVWGDMNAVSLSTTTTGGQRVYLAVNRYMAGTSGGVAAAGAAGGAIGGLIYGLSASSIKPPGDYLEESASGPQDVKNLVVVVPNTLE